MRRILAYFLLLLFLAGTCGFYYGYRIATGLHYRNVQSELYSKHPSKKLLVIKLSLKSESSLLWKRAGKEFEWHGQLYDVVSLQHTPGKLTLLCYRDSKEKQLATAYSSAKARTNSSARILCKIMLANYLLPESVGECSLNPHLILFSTSIQQTHHSFIRHCFPPPESPILS